MSTDIVRKTGCRVMDDWATGHLIDWAAGKGAADRTKEVLREEILAVASELAGPEPSPVERMLAEAAAVAWFALRLHESQFAGASTGRDGLTIKQSEFHQRRIDRAHRRYLATLRSLAAVRKLALPSVQINVARRQVNVSGGPALPCATGSRAGGEPPVTELQRRFLEAYLSGPRGVQFNATRSAEAAGYAWPGKQGPRLRTFPEVAAAIRADRERRDREWRERSRERAKAAAEGLFLRRPGARRRRGKRQGWALHLNF